MGGINVISSSLERRIMNDSPLIIGLDTSHPPAGSQFPTTAAMVYSVDENVTDYRSNVKFQAPRQELISGLTQWVFVRINLINFIFGHANIV
jgi:Piwi domain